MNYKAALILRVLLISPLSAEIRAHRETTLNLQLPAPPAEVFPLFGPVRETEWSPDWKPRFLFPAESGQKVGAVFTTKHGAGDAVWVLAAYDESALRMTYVIVFPGMVATKLDIALKPAPDGNTAASVTYRQTALSEKGDHYVMQFADQLPGERDHWEQAIAHVLKSGTKK